MIRQIDNRKIFNRKINNRKIDNRNIYNRKIDNRMVDNRKIDNRKIDNRKIDTYTCLPALNYKLALCNFMLVTAHYRKQPHIFIPFLTVSIRV